MKSKRKENFVKKEKFIDMYDNKNNDNNSGTPYDNDKQNNNYYSTENNYQNQNNYNSSNKDKYWKQKNQQNNYEIFCDVKKNDFLGNKRSNNYSNYEDNLIDSFTETTHRYSNSKTQCSSNNKNFNNSDNYSNRNEEQTSKNNFNYKKKLKTKKDLPIFPFKNEILEKIEQNRVIIISGNTGCGKSTQVPQYIYNSDNKCKILMTQPRRIAAVSIAKRLAEEMNLKIGYKVGYHVSMNPNFCKDTSILVETTGLFMEEIIHKNLNYTHIILDEVHERDIYVDLVLALIKFYFEIRPKSKLKLILMSATIAEDSFAEYLKNINGGKIPIVKIEESLHKVHTFTLDSIFKFIKKDNSISKKIKNEVDNVIQSCTSQVKAVPVYMMDLFPVVTAIIEKIEVQNSDNKNGILIFIPGIGEIQELKDYLSKYFVNNKNLDFLILHSQISDNEQDEIFKSINNKRKIILATNIAESSITISNIDFVIDFCLVKQTRFDQTQNSTILELKWCSKASCQQRKGRTGRMNTGYYFQLITKKLSECLDAHPKPEILRTTLENPILKLKIYEPEYEPSEILLKTIDPPSEETILRTIFQLEKMGALIKGQIIKIKKDLNNDNFKSDSDKTVYYKSGVITTVGKIFAELPIDLKYSRLIMISFALGEIDLGITLAAILSQDRSIFLNSDACNRYNLYKVKDFCSFKKECDFIASYTAYRKWYYYYGHLLINENVKYDTQLKNIDKRKYMEIKNYTKKEIMDLRTLKEVIRTENDLKKRLAKFNLYNTHFESYKDPTKSINFQYDDNVLILKIILAGTFYNQIFVPEYVNTRNIEDYILDKKNSEKQPELRTIRLFDISAENAKKIVRIFESIAEPGQIIDDQYSESSMSYKLVFDGIEPLKKVLFVTSTAIRRNKELPSFYFKENNANNKDIIDTKDNKKNTKKDEDENMTLIKLDKEPEYYYRLCYYDEYLKENIFQDKDSINYIQIIPNLEKMRNCKLVTDTFYGKFSRNNNYIKYTKYSSVLPMIENFDKIMMLVFAPKYKMVGLEDGKTKKILKYKGFQSHEFTGLNDFSSKDIHENFFYERAILIKFDYLITNYHLNIINEIRVLINDIIKFKFISKVKNEQNNNELSKDEFDELFSEYKMKARTIIEKIKFLLNTNKIKNINNENYQELYDYINEKKYKNKIIQSFHGHSNQIEYETSTFFSDTRDFSEESNFSSNNNQNDIEEFNKLEMKEDNCLQSYTGYINAIYDLQKKIKPDDFLQLHEPLNIEGEYIFTDNKTIKELQSRNFKIQNLYHNVVKDLRNIENLCILKYGYLLCSKCFSEVCEIKKGYPIMTNKEIGEHKIESSWMNDNLKIVFNKNNKTAKGIICENSEINNFSEKLKKLDIKFENLLSCKSGKHIVGYIRDNEKYIYFGSELSVKYPDLTYEQNIKQEYFLNDFEDIREKIDNIMYGKTKPEFLKKIFCKLCDFYVKNDVSEFRNHLKDKEHEHKLQELRKEFI